MTEKNQFLKELEQWRVYLGKIGKEQSKRKLHLIEEIIVSMLDNEMMRIAMINPNMEIVWVNKTFQKQFPHIDISKKPFCYQYFYSPPKEKICESCPAITAFKTGEINNAETGICADGRIYNVIATPVKNTDGTIVYVVETMEDITERKRAEKKLEILNKELLKSNKRLKQLALRDNQTGLYNYRYLEDVIHKEFEHSQKYGNPVSLIMFDIDYFKSINTVYGYRFGDLVIKQMGRLLKRRVRRNDIVIRSSGEEFIIISSGIDRSFAIVLAQRLIDDIALYNFGNKKQSVKLKMSVAVVSYPEDKAVKGVDLIEMGDRILNKAKERGGDCIYSSEDIIRKKASDSDIERADNITDIKVLRERIRKLTMRENQSLIESVFAFAKTIKLKDHYTGEHIERIVNYAVDIARALNFSRDDIELVRQASILHDLGKVGISDKILLKNGKLTNEEFEEIKKHPQIGVDIIRPIQFLHNLIPLILYHHERWDGKGYPEGLKREEIPLGARIIALADVYQALISDRPYRKAFSPKAAISIIKENSNTQFDPKIVEIFLQILFKEKTGV